MSVSDIEQRTQNKKKKVPSLVAGQCLRQGRRVEIDDVNTKDRLRLEFNKVVQKDSALSRMRSEAAAVEIAF